MWSLFLNRGCSKTLPWSPARGRDSPVTRGFRQPHVALAPGTRVGGGLCLGPTCPHRCRRAALLLPHTDLCPCDPQSCPRAAAQGPPKPPGRTRPSQRPCPPAIAPPPSLPHPQPRPRPLAFHALSCRAPAPLRAEDTHARALRHIPPGRLSSRSPLGVPEPLRSPLTPQPIPGGWPRPRGPPGHCPGTLSPAGRGAPAGPSPPARGSQCWPVPLLAVHP